MNELYPTAYSVASNYLEFPYRSRIAVYLLSKTCG